MPWPGDSKGTIQSLSQAATCHLFTTHSRGFTLSPKLLNAKQGSCEYTPISLVFGLTRLEIKPKHIALVADALFIRPLAYLSQTVFEQDLVYLLSLVI